jgi:hypothetical protein
LPNLPHVRVGRLGCRKPQLTLAGAD